MKRIILLLAALPIAAPALADECDSASTQAELNRCTAEQYQAADNKLNTAWQAELQRATPQQQPLLKKAQQAWIVLRDADCALLSSGSEGGSVQSMLVNQCLTEKTAEREAFLVSLMQCEEGDLSCSLPATR